MPDDISPTATKKTLSKRGPIAALALTAAFLASAAVPGVMGAPARGLLCEVAAAPTIVSPAHQDEIMYLSAPRIVDPRTNTWSVKGMKTLDGDWNKDAIVFTVRPTPTQHPDQIVAPIDPRTVKAYSVTYNDAACAQKNAKGQKQATLLAAKALPEPSHSGVPFYWPPGTWSRAFSPF